MRSAQVRPHRPRHICVALRHCSARQPYGVACCLIPLGTAMPSDSSCDTAWLNQSIGVAFSARSRAASSGGRSIYMPKRNTTVSNECFISAPYEAQRNAVILTTSLTSSWVVERARRSSANCVIARWIAGLSGMPKWRVASDDWYGNDGFVSVNLLRRIGATI